MHSWSGFLLANAVALATLAAAQGPPAGAGEAAVGQDKRPASTEALFARLAKMPGLEAKYVEEKHLGLLALPLKSEGVLYFMRPGYLVRVVEKPQKSMLTITPSELRMVGSDGVEVVDLRQSHELRLFVTSLVRVFSGDRKGLDSSYVIDYQPGAADDNKWTLTLKPRARPLTEMIKSLRLHGAGLVVSKIEMREPNGDRSVMSIVAADPERRFSSAEKARLFGIEDDRSGSTKKAPVDGP